MFNWRALQEEDYEKLKEWWKWFRFPAPSKEMLPNNGLSGIMVTKGEEEICAGFLYQTNSTFCLIEYIVSNPEYKNKDRKQGVQFLIEVLGEIAKEKGYRLVFSSVKNENLVNTFKKSGFSISEAKEVIKLI